MPHVQRCLLIGELEVVQRPSTKRADGGATLEKPWRQWMGGQQDGWRKQLPSPHPLLGKGCRKHTVSAVKWLSPRDRGGSWRHLAVAFSTLM